MRYDDICMITHQDSLLSSWYYQDFIKVKYLSKNSLKWHRFRPLRTNYGSSVGVYILLLIGIAQYLIRYLAMKTGYHAIIPWCQVGDTDRAPYEIHIEYIHDSYALTV